MGGDQPRSQGLSSYRPLERARRDPSTRWSRVSQNLGDGNEIIKGMGGLVGILSRLNLRECRMSYRQKKPREMMLLFCKCQGKLIYNQTAEIQVAVACAV